MKFAHTQVTPFQKKQSMRKTFCYLCLSLLLLSACKNPETHDDHAGHDDEFTLVSFNYDPGAYEPAPLQYEITGQGDTALFFVHGWNIDQGYWAEQVPYFSARYRVVTIDLPGHGESGKERKNWTVESYAKDLVSVIERENLENVVLIGHSMSGDITLHTALQIPERVIGLVGVDNFQDIDFELNDEMRFQLSGVINEFERDYRQMTETFARQLLLTKTESEEIKNRVITDYKRADPAIAIPVLKYTFPSYARIKENLPRLHIPLQLISCGRGDTNEEALKKACPKGVNIRYIDNAGHFPMIEKPTEFNMVLAELLTGL
jgi:pimeloyl-ACP methyl ester carboxylesterase